MEQKCIKVLSIDFDYFQHIRGTEAEISEVFTAYPDPLDLNTSMTEVTWGSHYANPYSAELLHKVELNVKEFNAIKEVLNRQIQVRDIMICNSHKYLYDFICDTVGVGNGYNVEVVNIDMHHDICNANFDTVDCGNWGYHLKNEYKEGYTHRWVYNPVKPDNLEFIQANYAWVSPANSISKGISPDEQFDMVFLCRSDTWTPPHLDKYFAELYDFILNKFYEKSCITGQKCITTERDCSKIVEFMKQVESKGYTAPLTSCL